MKIRTKIALTLCLAVAAVAGLSGTTAYATGAPGDPSESPLNEYMGYPLKFGDTWRMRQKEVSDPELSAYLTKRGAWSFNPWRKYAFRYYDHNNDGENSWSFCKAWDIDAWLSVDHQTGKVTNWEKWRCRTLEESSEDDDSEETEPGSDNPSEPGTGEGDDNTGGGDDNTGEGDDNTGGGEGGDTGDEETSKVPFPIEHDGKFYVCTFDDDSWKDKSFKELWDPEKCKENEYDESKYGDIIKGLQCEEDEKCVLNYYSSDDWYFCTASQEVALASMTLSEKGIAVIDWSKWNCKSPKPSIENPIEEPIGQEYIAEKDGKKYLCIYAKGDNFRWKSDCRELKLADPNAEVVPEGTRYIVEDEDGKTYICVHHKGDNFEWNQNCIEQLIVDPDTEFADPNAEVVPEGTIYIVEDEDGKIYLCKHEKGDNFEGNQNCIEQLIVDPDTDIVPEGLIFYVTFGDDGKTYLCVHKKGDNFEGNPTCKEWLIVGPDTEIVPEGPIFYNILGPDGKLYFCVHEEGDGFAGNEHCWTPSIVKHHKKFYLCIDSEWSERGCIELPYNNGGHEHEHHEGHHHHGHHHDGHHNHNHHNHHHHNKCHHNCGKGREHGHAKGGCGCNKPKDGCHCKPGQDDDENNQNDDHQSETDPNPTTPKPSQGGSGSAGSGTHTPKNPDTYDNLSVTLASMAIAVLGLVSSAVYLYRNELE